MDRGVCCSALGTDFANAKTPPSIFNGSVQAFENDTRSTRMK